MATWAEVRNHITSKYNIAQDNGGHLVMEFETTIGRSQVVHVFGSDTTVFLKSAFAKVGQVQPGRVFEAAEMFGVCQMGDLYCLTHLMLTETLDALEFDVPLSLLTDEADKIEKILGTGDEF